VGKSRCGDPFGMTVRVEKLVEYQKCVFPRDAITEDVAGKLYAQFKNQIDIEPPSFLNGHSWSLTQRGGSAIYRSKKDFHIYLAPKIPINNLFGMLEYAYRLDFKTLEGIKGAETICELYERLALILAKRVLNRIRKGIYRTYLAEANELPYVRGKIDVAEQVRHALRPSLPCLYEDHTANIEDNQILVWTLTEY